MDVDIGMASVCVKQRFRPHNSYPSHYQRHQWGFFVPSLAIHTDYACVPCGNGWVQYLGCENITDDGDCLTLRPYCRLCHYDYPSLDYGPKKYGLYRLHRRFEQWRLEQRWDILSCVTDFGHVLQSWL